MAEPLQTDIFKDVAPPPADKLCALIVVTSYRNRHADQSSPAFIGLGIPNKNISDWHILKPITALLAQYHDTETKQHAPKEISVTVKDRAIPILKKRPNQLPEAEE